MNQHPVIIRKGSNNAYWVRDFTRAHTWSRFEQRRAKEALSPGPAPTINTDFVIKVILLLRKLSFLSVVIITCKIIPYVVMRLLTRSVPVPLM